MTVFTIHLTGADTDVSNDEPTFFPGGVITYVPVDSHVAKRWLSPNHWLSVDRTEPLAERGRG